MVDAPGLRSRRDPVGSKVTLLRTLSAPAGLAPSGLARPALQVRRSPVPTLRCRTIEEGDLDAVVRLLGHAFPARSEGYWRLGLARHVARPLAPHLPRYGYLLEADGEPAGVLLTLHTDQGFKPGGGQRCNLSSFYVDPRFRPQAALLDRIATRNRDITSLNVTPAPHTWPLLEANGYTRHVRGQILAVPSLAKRHAGISIRAVAADDSLDELDPGERRLVRDHVGYGCLGFLWSDGTRHAPLLLQPRRIGVARLVPRLRVPCLYVVYCGAIEDLPRLARPLGRLMVGRYRTPLLLVDAAGPVAGLPGRFFADRGVKYTRGPNPVTPGDLAYTEIVLFGP